jgi:hypothetical protein
MSQIKTLTTQFKSLESLLKALTEAGVPQNAIEVDRTLKNALPLVDYYRNTNPNALTVRIRKDVTGAYEDTGFKYNPATRMFEAQVSTHDYDQNFGERKLLQTTVRYNVNESKRLAKRQGYILQESVLQDGTIQLICTKYS